MAQDGSPSIVAAFRRQGRTREIDYAFALFNLGSALRQSGRPGDAIPFLEERLRVSDYKRAVVQRELALAYTRIGDVQGRPMFPNLGQTSAALASYEHAWSLLDDAAQAQPESAAIAHDLIVVAQRRADLIGITLNRTPEGIEQTERNRQRILSELARHPNDFVFEGDLFGMPTKGPAPVTNAVTEHFAQALDKLGLKVDKILPVHGEPGTMDDLKATLAKKPPASATSSSR